MNTWMTALVGLCLIALLMLSAYRAVTKKSVRSFAIGFFAVLTISIFLYVLFGFPKPTETIAKSGSSGPAVAVALFVCMLLGMLAQYAYNYLIAPKTDRKAFDVGVFIAPVFASPIVFIPLLAAFQNADIDLAALTIPRMMVFLVAFQNGFFWKDFFDRQRQTLFNSPQGQANLHQ
jgi:hypothetical protein